MGARSGGWGWGLTATGLPGSYGDDGSLLKIDHDDGRPTQYIC